MDRRSKAGALSAERIECEALALVEEEGLEEFSIRKLAARLGCQAMSLYHHYPSKAHLMDAMLDRIIASTPFPSADLPWDARLAMLARDFRAVALRHPRFFPFLATHRLNTPTGLRWIDHVIASFRAGGLGDEDAARLFRAFGYYLMGAGLDETAGYSKGPGAAAAVPEDQIARDFPNVFAAGRYFQPAEREATFELGLSALLDAARVRSKA
jgi:AcrR family transcriptional regulator